MDLRKFNTAHRRASKAESQMNSQCETMASMLQEFFDEEITVLWQAGDGFVVLHDKENLNTPVNEVIEAVNKNLNAFR